MNQCIHGDWGWGLGIFALFPNPQSPIPNPQSSRLLNNLIFFNISEISPKNKY